MILWNTHRKNYFNPLPPHGGRHSVMAECFECLYISIHSLRMEGDILIFPSVSRQIISIHSLRMEGDSDVGKIIPNTIIFQSTPSAWRETDACQFGKWAHSISIHSLRMEGDRIISFTFDLISHFNPLPPHGGRHIYSRYGLFCAEFQSTPSAWRETPVSCWEV